MVLTVTGYVPIEAGSLPSPAGRDSNSVSAAESPLSSESKPPPRSNQALGKYNADQPRVPAGSSDGGQWTSGSASGESSSELSDSSNPRGDSRSAQYAADDTGVPSPPANDNLTPEETCRRAYADAVAFVRADPSLSSDDYIKERQQSAQSLNDCLDLASGVSPIYRGGASVFFHGGGIIIFRQGRPPIYVPSPRH